MISLLRSNENSGARLHLQRQITPLTYLTGGAIVVMRILQMHKDWKKKKRKRWPPGLSISAHVQQVNVKYELHSSVLDLLFCFLGSYLVHSKLA